MIKTYICPNNVALIYKTTTREGYKEYRCFEEICMCCPHKDKCLGEKAKYKIIKMIIKIFLKPRREKLFTIEEKKPLSEASQIQKICMGFAMLVSVDTKKCPNNVC